MKRIIVIIIGVFISFHLCADDFPGVENICMYNDSTCSLRPLLKWDKSVKRSHLCEDGITRDIYLVGYRVYEDGILREIFSGGLPNLVDRHWRNAGYHKEYVVYRVPPSMSSHSYSISLGWSFVPLNGSEDISDVEIFESPRSEEFFVSASPYFGWEKDGEGYIYELISEEDRTCRLIQCAIHEYLFYLASWTNGFYGVHCLGDCPHSGLPSEFAFGYKLVELAPQCFVGLTGIRNPEVSVFFSETISTIADSAFWVPYYPKIVDIHLSRSVVTIGKHAFENRANRVHYIFFPGDSIPPLMTTIGEYAFSSAAINIKSRRLCIPKTVDSIAKNAFYDADFPLYFTLVVGWDIPLDIDDDTFRNLRKNNGVKEERTLEVPPGTIELYRAAKGWRHFDNIVETVVDDIPEIESSPGYAKEVKRFSLEGQPLCSPQRGLNIIRMDDGSVRKVLVK